MLSVLSYGDCYKEKTDYWTVKTYPEFLNDQFKSQQTNPATTPMIDFPAIKNALLSEDLKARKAAQEAVKNTYRVTHFQVWDSTQCLSFQNLKQIYGHRISAHGVEEVKGGLMNILLMCITNVVRTHCWGQLMDGPPQASPVRHGPYYIVYTTTATDEDAIIDPSLQACEYILVPFKEVSKMLSDKLKEASKDGLISNVDLNKFTSKIITYDALLKKLSKDKKETSSESQVVKERKSKRKRTASTSQNRIWAKPPPEKRKKLTCVRQP